MMASYLDLKVGYTCNNKCIHCIIQKQRKDAVKIRGNEDRSTQECLDELLDSSKKGLDIVVFTGGEATIRKDFIEIAAYAKQLNFATCLQTNGRKLADNQYAVELNKYIDGYVIAIHGSNEQIHDQITKDRNSFRETIEGIKNIRELNENVCGKIVLSNNNYKDLPGILELLGSLKINSQFNIAFPHYFEDDVEQFNKIVPYYSDIAPFIEESISIAEKLKINIEFEQIFPCVLKKQYSPSYFTDLHPKYENAELKQLDCETLDWNKASKMIKLKDKKCKSCIYDAYCDGFWKEYINLRGFDEFRPCRSED